MDQIFRSEEFAGFLACSILFSPLIAYWFIKYFWKKSKGAYTDASMWDIFKQAITPTPEVLPSVLGYGLLIVVVGLTATGIDELNRLDFDWYAAAAWVVGAITLMFIARMALNWRNRVKQEEKNYGKDAIFYSIRRWLRLIALLLVLIFIRLLAIE